MLENPMVTGYGFSTIQTEKQPVYKVDEEVIKCEKCESKIYHTVSEWVEFFEMNFCDEDCLNDWINDAKVIKSKTA